jgi:hypothetical protein
MLMHISMKQDRYNPKVLANAINRHITSPARHHTVAAQPMSMGIIRKITWKLEHIQRYININHKLDSEVGKTEAC